MRISVILSIWVVSHTGRRRLSRPTTFPTPNYCGAQRRNFIDEHTSGAISALYLY
jgi:hypothetical protein